MASSSLGAFEANRRRSRSIAASPYSSGQSSARKALIVALPHPEGRSIKSVVKGGSAGSAVGSEDVAAPPGGTTSSLSAPLEANGSGTSIEPDSSPDLLTDDGSHPCPNVPVSRTSAGPCTSRLLTESTSPQGSVRHLSSSPGVELVSQPGGAEASTSKSVKGRVNEAPRLREARPREVRPRGSSARGGSKRSARCEQR